MLPCSQRALILVLEHVGNFGVRLPPGCSRHGVSVHCLCVQILSFYATTEMTNASKIHCFLVDANKSYVIATSDSVVTLHSCGHTPSIAFRHLPPNSARFSYATEGALFISAQLSSDAVSALRKILVLIR